MNYSEKLKDPRWQKRRLDILSRDKFTCQQCLSEDQTLIVHHLSYSGEPWDATDDMLITLCEDCHDQEHKAKLELGSVVSKYCSKSNSLNSELLDFLNSMSFHDSFKNLNIVSSDLIAYALQDDQCMQFIYDRRQETRKPSDADKHFK